ncbi:MAG TPA: hypothetical protein VF573_14405 [Paraburkholderia sp.]|uniref:hypothetical protein n=1 Tax=Paraburkholderia sp. TaxID=1926495 RepID=UPI002ED3350A
MTTEFVVTPELLGANADAETARRVINRSGCDHIILVRLPPEIALALAEELAETGHAVTIDGAGDGQNRSLDVEYRELISRAKSAR